jgi:hypothetical protein
MKIKIILLFICLNLFYSLNIILKNKEEFCINKNFSVSDLIYFNFQYSNITYINNTIYKTELYSPMGKIIFSSNQIKDNITLNVNADGNYKICFNVKFLINNINNCQISFDLKTNDILNEILKEQMEINKIFENISQINSNVLQLYDKISNNKEDLTFNDYILNLNNLVNSLTLIKILATIIMSIINIFIIKKLIKNKELQEMIKNFIKNPFDNKNL